MDSPPARTEGLRMLARRELSAHEVRARLQDRGFPPDEIEAAVGDLQAAGAIDDRRVALAYARTAVKVKGRGRLRILRELAQMGIAREVISEALGEVFGDLDERQLIAEAIRKKLHGRTRLADASEYARLYQFLMRQGFTPDGVATALRRFRSGRPADEE